MKTKKDYLIETDSKHSDFVDSFAYMIAAQEVKIRDEYVLAFIKKKPNWLPLFIYNWLLKKLFNIALFK